MRILFVTAGFVYSRQRSTVTDGGCRQEHLTRNFSHALCTSDCVHAHCMAQDEPRLKCVSVRVSFHLHPIHDVMCLSVRWSFLVSLSPVSLRLLLLLFHTLPVSGPAHHLQCRHRRGLKALHTRRMRSIAPWRFSIFSQLKHCLPLVLVARFPVMWKRVFIMTLNTLLVNAWARSKPALMFSWRLHVNGPSYAPNTGYGSPCNTCTVTPGFWVMNVPVMPLHSVRLASFPGTTMPLAGFVITLTHLPVVMVVTASARFWKDCIAS